MIDDDIETAIDKLFSMKNGYRVISKEQTGSRRNFFRDVDNDAKTFSYLTFIERQAGSDRFSLCCGYLNIYQTATVGLMARCGHPELSTAADMPLRRTVLAGIVRSNGYWTLTSSRQAPARHSRAAWRRAGSAAGRLASWGPRRP